MTAAAKTRTIQSEGRDSLVCWLDSNGISQPALADRVREWGITYSVAELAGFSKMQVNHIVRGRRSPTAAQAVALWHITLIEPGAWLRSSD